jgi:hypothetical protein
MVARSNSSPSPVEAFFDPVAAPVEALLDAITAAVGTFGATLARVGGKCLAGQQRQAHSQHYRFPIHGSPSLGVSFQLLGRRTRWERFG